MDRPGSDALLDAVARFLEDDVRPLVTDARASFRLLIAASLARSVALELRLGEGHVRRQLASLGALLGRDETEVNGSPSPRETLARLEAELSAGLRDGTVDAKAAHAHVKAALAEALAIASPRFSLAAEIE